MKKTRGLKAILASLLVTVALAAPAAMLSIQTGEPEAELYFSGVSLETLSDGTIQAVFKVSVDKAINCYGATFFLDYNPDYFTPSYMVETTIDGVTHKRNEIFTSTTNPYDDGFFAYARDLYRPDVNPFQDRVVIGYEIDSNFEKVPVTKEYSIVSVDMHHIDMELLIDKDKIDEDGPLGKLTPLKGVSLAGPMGATIETVYVLNKYDTFDTDGNVANPERVVLGELSFQVKPERLDEIARYFPEREHKKTTDPDVLMDVKTEDGEDIFTYLIRTTKPEPEDRADDNWQIPVWASTSGSDKDYMSLQWYREGGQSLGYAQRYYELAVDPKQLMTIRPAEEKVTINSYQAFTDGTWGDIAQALRRYSPMATATYADGTEENMVIPWGQEEKEYEYTVSVKGANGTFTPVKLTDNSTYNPLEGVYQVTQKIKKADGTFHPVPITVTLTVTPIKLIDVQVENQVLTYDLFNVVDEVKSPSDLLLPEKARLITDIVPSGVSMVMKIPAWTQQNLDNTRNVSWPVLDPTDPTSASVLMNAIKEDSFGPGSVAPDVAGTKFDRTTMPYWPAENDNDKGYISKDVSKDESWRFLKQKSNNWIGEYTFRMSETYGGEVKPGFTKAEIQTVFPWLTVEEDSYPVPGVLRQIVTDTNFTDTLNYTASYVSTKVLDAKGQEPELTLAVRKGTETQLRQMDKDSEFRVWLPNGQELGTGQNITVWPNYSEDNTVKENVLDDWFPKTVVGENTVQNGNYHTEGQGGGDETVDYFHLVMNPGDPTTGGDETFPENRETLRRYINLGGWYKVAVCEDRESNTWSDPMPVYVPPRPNEYQSDKVYNFVGENADLFNWPGGLTHYVTMPQGNYTAVTADGVRLYDVKDKNGDDEILSLDELQAKAEKERKDAKDAETAGGTAGDLFYSNYLDDKYRPKTTTSRHEEFYGYHTTYDGSTGAQPGTLYSFRVGPVKATTPGDDWNEAWAYTEETFKTAATATPPDVPIWRYGPDPFYDGAIYPAFGTVTQPASTRLPGSDPSRTEPYNVTVRKSGGEGKEAGKPKITLTSDSPTGITREDPNDMGSNVTLATYDTRTVKYTDRQEYTFKITNVGTAPVYGLAIDGFTDGYKEDPTGGRFEMLQAPASFLAPGQSTTFVLTYVYNLDPNGEFNKDTGKFYPDIYRDTLYIISSDHPTAKHPDNGGTNQNDSDTIDDYDYLLDFDAEFRVTGKITHSVTVVVKPGDLSMGSAGLIVGKQSDNTMNYTVTTRSYAAGDKVYVAVYMKDLYDLTGKPTYEYATVEDQELDEIVSDPDDPASIVLLPNIKIYWFDMPDYDTIVTVEFFEDILSKLRLADIVDFSADKEGKLKPYTNPVAGEIPEEEDKDTFRVWRKSYTTAERNAAKDWAKKQGQNPDEDLYLMTAGTAIPRDEGGRAFIDTENQYIVVIPFEAEYSQVEAKLRKLVTYSDYNGIYNDPNDPKYEADGSLKKYNLDIKPDVVMHHYGADIRKTWNLTVDTADKKYDSSEDPSLPTTDNKTTGDTAVPTVHTSEIFHSPEPGTSNYVRITVSYTEDGVTTSRYYYLEIHRAPEEPIATLNYGNSPYGMIMNDKDTFSTDVAQKRAKEDFTKNNYSFKGLGGGVIPQVIHNGAVSQDVIYWREAWVHNTQLFEPESLTGFTITYPSPTPTPTPTATPTPDPDATPSPSPTPDPNANQRVPVTFPDSKVYVEAENLDLNDCAYFAILGENLREPGVAEAFDSTGRAVKLEDIHVRAKVTLLDTDATTQIGRFSGTETVFLDLGNLDKTGTGKELEWLQGTAQAGKWPVSSETTEGPDTEKETTYTQVEHIRPGQYVMEYTYGDYNGKTLTVTRPFVILSSVGDVNCDIVVDSTREKATGKNARQTDEAVLKNRVADPLGYVAGRWEWMQEETPSGEWEWKWKETVYERSNIFKYRVVDVNNDRNVNNIDGNLIDKIARGTAEAIRFYNPVNYGID